MLFSAYIYLLVNTAPPVLYNLCKLDLKGNGELFNVALFWSEIRFESSFQQMVGIHD